MKSILLAELLSIAIAAETRGQNGPQLLNSNVLVPAPYSVVERNANSSVWERTTYEPKPSGELVPQVHRYTELASGLHYWSNGQWLDSKEEIQIQPQGGAAATHGQYQVYFPSDITSINMNGTGDTNDCIAYINKLTAIGILNSSKSPILSASAAGYGNTNYIVDDVNIGYCGDDTVPPTTNGLIAAGVSTLAIQYLTGCETSANLPHLTNAPNVAGYICWGSHSSLGGNYAVDRTVQWSGNSGWWIIRTEESFNGIRGGLGQGNFLQWFSSNAFGGTNYSNTPIGGPTYVNEPTSAATDNSLFFDLWASGRNLAVCCWVSCTSLGPVNSQWQVVGDPFVTR